MVRAATNEGGWLRSPSRANGVGAGQRFMANPSPCQPPPPPFGDPVCSWSAIKIWHPSYAAGRVWCVGGAAWASGCGLRAFSGCEVRTCDGRADGSHSAIGHTASTLLQRGQRLVPVKMISHPTQNRARSRRIWPWKWHGRAAGNDFGIVSPPPPRLWRLVFSHQSRNHTFNLNGARLDPDRHHARIGRA